jgi:hypothetical protein
MKSTGKSANPQGKKRPSSVSGYRVSGYTENPPIGRKPGAKKGK